jgi:tRNA 2-thiouridine synthesizing protein A
MLNMSSIEIDARGKPCPMPLLLLKKAMKQNGASQQYFLISSDPNSEIDILRYCSINNLSCNFSKISSSEFHYLIES